MYLRYKLETDNKKKLKDAVQNLYFIRKVIKLSWNEKRGNRTGELVLHRCRLHQINSK